MTIQEEMQRALEARAKAIDDRAEADRLAGLVAESRREDSATAFAAAFEAALDHGDDDDDEDPGAA